MTFDEYLKKVETGVRGGYGYSLRETELIRKAWDHQQKRIDESDYVIEKQCSLLQTLSESNGKLEEELRTTKIALSRFVDAFNESRVIVGQSFGLGPSGEHIPPITIERIK